MKRVFAAAISSSGSSLASSRNTATAVAKSGIDELQQPTAHQQEEKKARTIRPWAVVGLGNPGKEYEWTRHNAGFLCIEALRQRWALGGCASSGALKFSESWNAQYIPPPPPPPPLNAIQNGKIIDVPVILAKPQTFMNRSGNATRELLEKHKVLRENLIVIYDDMDLPLGTLRLRVKGSSTRGHLGIFDIEEKFGKQHNVKFVRIRVGIGRPMNKGDTIDYVLQKFFVEEREIVKQTTEHVCDCVEALVSGQDVQLVMSKFNKSYDALLLQKNNQ